MMQLQQIKPIHFGRKSRRVGRGGKRGTYSGRGLKGQKSRTGARIRPALRDLIKKFPKLRGWKFKPVGKKPQVVNLGDLEKKFEGGAEITPQALLEAGLIHRIKGRLPEVKLLGDGSLTKKLLVKDCQMSKSAKEKIEKAGGTLKSQIQSSNVKSNPKSK